MNFEVTPLSLVNIEIRIHDFLVSAQKALKKSVQRGFKIDFDLLIEAVFLLTGFTFVPLNELPKRCEGLTSFDNGTFSISCENWENIKKNHRARFSLAHEITHVILHRDQAENFSSQVARNNSQIPAYMCSEWQANAGAAALLAPFDKFSELMDKSSQYEESTLIKLLAKRFNISKECAIRRYQTIQKYRADPKKLADLTKGVSR